MRAPRPSTAHAAPMVSSSLRRSDSAEAPRVPRNHSGDRRGSISLARLRKLAYWLDGVGLDPLLGLIPGAGDAAGAVLSAWVLIEAFRLGASRATLLRMAGNVVLDAGLGAIPVVGDFFDFVWKANLRNVALLERHLAAPAQAGRADRAFVWLIISDALGLPRATRQPLAFRSVPHPEPAQRIAVALADRYTVERELGRGGMATVYLAEEKKHGRKVAIKVLRPEITATPSTERFL